MLRRQIFFIMRRKYHKRSFNWKEKCQVLSFLKYRRKLQEWPKSARKKWIMIYLKTVLQIFPYFACKLWRLSSSNSLSFVIKCLPSFRDIRHYLKWGAAITVAMVTAVALKPMKKNFGHMLKRWCSIKEIEVYLLCEILISKDRLQGQKNCCEPP